MKRKQGHKDAGRCHFWKDYRPHLACFACRKKFHYDKWSKLKGRLEHLCPECKQPLHDMGWDFKAPRKNDKKQWEKVRILYTKGIRWKSPICGCYGPGHHFRTLREAKEYNPAGV